MGHMVWNVAAGRRHKIVFLNFDKCEYIPWNVFWKYRAVNDRYRSDYLIKNRQEYDRLAHKRNFSIIAHMTMENPP